MSNLFAILKILGDLWSGYAQFSAKAWEVINRARAEGRDISDAELAALKADRKAAVKAWRDAAP